MSQTRDRHVSLLAIAGHVILSAAKNLPSSRLDVQRKPSPTRLRGDMGSLAPPQPDREGACVPPASPWRMTNHARMSTDAAGDPSSACLPMILRQAGRLPQDDSFGARRQTGTSAPPSQRIFHRLHLAATPLAIVGASLVGARDSRDGNDPAELTRNAGSCHPSIPRLSAWFQTVG